MVNPRDKITIPSITVIKCKSYLYKIKTVTVRSSSWEEIPGTPLKKGGKERWVLFVASDLSISAKNKSIN